MANGEVVIERLTAMKNSLERATQTMEEELSRRSAYDAYRELYLDNIRRLQTDVLRLEDQVRAFVHGG